MHTHTHTHTHTQSMHSVILLRTRDKLIEEREVIKEAVRCYNVQKDTYRRWAVEFEMMQLMSGSKGQDLGDPEMVLTLKLVQCHVSIYCIIFKPTPDRT